MNVTVALSKLEASRKNPRRVKPEREAHRKLVASIRAHGLLEPLVVCPTEKTGVFRVIAGNRRLAALRDIHRHGDPTIDCVVREADDAEAASLSLAENFAREPMHPLDEAEAFARLASVECKGVNAIAAEFGVTHAYVRQRMKLAKLAKEIKAALRSNEIGVSIAEAFAALSSEQQSELWLELGGAPRTAEQVRDRIENEWISADHALFDVDSIEPSSMMTDLFGGGQRIARKEFLRAQGESLVAEQVRLLEDGWQEVLVGRHEDLSERLYQMKPMEGTYDDATTRRLEELHARQQVLEDAEPETDEEQDANYRELEALDAQERSMLAEAKPIYTEAHKATGTVLLILSPDGKVARAYGEPKRRDTRESRNTSESLAEEPVPSADALSDRQKTAIYTHELLAVREVLASDAMARKRLLVLMLHDKIDRESLALRRVMTGAGLHAEIAESFSSVARDAHRIRRRDVDPFAGDERLSEVEAYQRLKLLSEEQLDAIIEVLTVEFLTAATLCATPLVRLLGNELNVSLRKEWTPDSEWLNGYRKSQLADLVGVLRGPAHAPSALQRKKSELVTDLAALFEQAAHSPASIKEPELAERLNTWLPTSIGLPRTACTAG